MTSFAHSRLAAGLQQIVSRRREETGIYAEVVDLLQLPSTGRVLEVGCGSGLQLKVTRKIRPNLELFGLDLSAAAIGKAKRNLEGMGVELHVGNIESTTFESEYFDLVTCFTSMSYWSNLVTCFNEIHRILKPGGFAKLVEPQEDIDLDEVVEVIRSKLADKSRIRRFLAANFNKLGLKYGRKIGLRLYSMREVEGIVQRSRFADEKKLERVAIHDLPIFMLVSMTKQRVPNNV